MSGSIFTSSLSRLLIAAFAVLPLSSTISSAQGTRLWTQSGIEQLEKGTPAGVEITSDGRLLQGPALTSLLTTPSTFVWSVAVDKSGIVYLGTGSPATILRVDPKQPEKFFTLFETKDASVQSLRVGADGALYAATLPSGRVYRLDSAASAKIDESKATIVFDPAKLSAAKPSTSHYVWDLTFDNQGRLYIATGNPAAIYRADPAKIDPAKPNAAVTEFFTSDEAHIRSLAWDAKGNLIAGSDGSGLVYRIDPQGKGYILFAAPRREVTSVAVAADGTIYAACAGGKGRNPLPPLPVHENASATITIIQPNSLQAVNGSASLPEGSEIFALAEGQAPRKLWADKNEIVYALESRRDGLLALTGNRGRLLRIESNGDYADLAHLEAQQALCFATSGERLYLGSGNTGRIFALDAKNGKHEYASTVLDAGALARFGRVENDPGSSGFQIFTRSGNVEQPVRGWTEWTPLKDGAAASPAGRYFQWKAVLDAGASLAGVGVNYLAVNAAPVVDELTVVPGTRVTHVAEAPGAQTVPISFAPAASGTHSAATDATASAPLQAAKDRTSVTARWAAHDDNGDALVYSLFLLGDGEHVWRPLKSGLTEKSYSFDATRLPDGGYLLKVVASDAPAHTPADALKGEKISTRFVIDTTPPVVANLKALRGPAAKRAAQIYVVSFEAEDATSPIARAEFSLDAGPWQFVEPIGKLSDARHESYSLRVGFDSGSALEHLLTVRVFDRYENVGVAKIVISAEAK